MEQLKQSTSGAGGGAVGNGSVSSYLQKLSYKIRKLRDCFLAQFAMAKHSIMAFLCDGKRSDPHGR
jgi:hypothetical protein